MYEYIIVGDTVKFKNCLISCGFKDKEQAKRVLNRMLNNPMYEDECAMKGMNNIHVLEVESKNCWWNYSYY